MDNIIIAVLVIVILNLVITEDNLRFAAKALGQAIIGLFSFIAAVLLVIGTNMQDFSVDACEYFEKRKNEGN